MTTPEQNALIETHLGLARFMAKKYYSIAKRAGRKPYFHDAVSDAQLGLVLAGRSFDPTLGVPFQTYAGLCMQRELFDRLIRRNRLRNRFQFGDNDFKYNIEGRADMETALACHEVAEMLNRIGPRERDVLHSWCRGELLKDIAKRMGLSHERTRQIRNKALSQLRGIIAANTRQRHESWLAVA